ncbi:galactose-specific lectin nattectin-like [Myripristis murdjan]|uniref:galactose-specific lectin nattectin-like n=1 Tax=Myripristis murdjan TaxID=586833 RepID=UPI0011762703|nr:galactose-specific lectin nattectin-like [Myripristis murdjan]
MTSAFLFALGLCLASVLVTGGWLAFLVFLNEEPCCPFGWTKFGSRCFNFNYNSKIWADAERTCISFGGNLASVHSLEELNLLKAWMNRVTSHLAQTWIGGHDAVKEGVWLWSDGSSLNFTQWAHGQPNNSGDEDCVEILWRSSTWYDSKCTHSRPFICAKRL